MSVLTLAAAWPDLLGVAFSTGALSATTRLPNEGNQDFFFAGSAESFFDSVEVALSVLFALVATVDVLAAGALLTDSADFCTTVLSTP